MNKYSLKFVLSIIILSMFFSIYFFSIEYLSEFISSLFYLNLISSMIISIIITTTAAGTILSTPAIKKDDFIPLLIPMLMFVFTGKYLFNEVSEVIVYRPHIDLSSPVNLLILLMSIMLGLTTLYNIEIIKYVIINYVVHFSHIIIISSILILLGLNIMKLTNIIIDWLSYTLNLNSILSTVLLIVLLCMCIGLTIFILVFFTKIGDNDIIMLLIILLIVTMPIFLTGIILNVISYILQEHSISSMLILSSIEGKNQIHEIIAHRTLTIFISTMIIAIITEILYIFTKKID